MELPIVDGRLRVVVKPNKRKTEVLKVDERGVHVALKARPKDGEANAELERFLTKLTGRQARITSGFTAKRKTVRLS